MMKRILSTLLLAVFCLGFEATDGHASAGTEIAAPQVIWRLLDYIAVDYRGAVENGEVVSASEYAEMVEFAQEAKNKIAALPPNQSSSTLLAFADQLISAIDRKADAELVARSARTLAREVLAVFPVPVAPSRPPSLSRGAALYDEHCASCHGTAGRGDGSAGQALSPPPIAFTDETRARDRSIFGLYQVIEQGLEGTSMTSFDWLPPDDRWALAFYVGRFAYPDSDAASGERLWKSNADLRSAFPGLGALTEMTPAELAERVGDVDARAITAFLRNNPGVITAAGDQPLALAKARLAESLYAYQTGDRRNAQQLALSAYLDGFELHEVTLKLRNPALVRQIEDAMISLRSNLGRGAPSSDIQAQIASLSALLTSAEGLLQSDEATEGTSFVGAFTILLREGLEALLIVVGMLAFLVKTERKDLTVYVHLGWIVALAAGVLTWLVATQLVTVSGASRELTEGLGAISAVVVLGLVGTWMHNKSRADAWQIYIREKMSNALSRRSKSFLFMLAFLVVYREAFETILFYIALWSRGHTLEILLGAGLAILALAVVAWALMRFSRKLPTERLFLYSSFLIAFLVVVLMGKGVAALQEAGWVGISASPSFPRIEMLGIFPTWEGITAQILVLACLVVAYMRNGRQSAAPTGQA